MLKSILKTIKNSTYEYYDTKKELLIKKPIIKIALSTIKKKSEINSIDIEFKKNSWDILLKKNKYEVDLEICDFKISKNENNIIISIQCAKEPKITHQNEFYSFFILFFSSVFPIFNLLSLKSYSLASFDVSMSGNSIFITKKIDDYISNLFVNIDDGIIGYFKENGLLVSFEKINHVKIEELINSILKN